MAIGDVVIIQSEEQNRGKWPLGVVKELYKGRDSVFRALKLCAGQGFLERAVNQLYPLELSCDRDNPKPSETLNPAAPAFRPTRDTAAAVRERIKEIVEQEH